LFCPAAEAIAWLAAVFALPMNPEQRALYAACTGCSEPPAEQMREAWLPCGRRAGKSRVLAMVASYAAFFMDWKRFLTVGERGVICIVAADRAQARVIFEYLAGMLVDRRGIVDRLGLGSAGFGAQ
jgi:phage terminase large subunit-like protein